MKKHILPLVAAISLAAAALFATGVHAQADYSNSPFEFHNFMSNKTPADTMVSKEQYMAEMEKRWDMAHKRMGPNARKGWVSHRALIDALKQDPISKGGAQ